jgi:hypothetical protein
VIFQILAVVCEFLSVIFPSCFDVFLHVIVYFGSVVPLSVVLSAFDSDILAEDCELLSVVFLSSDVVISECRLEGVVPFFSIVHLNFSLDINFLCFFKTQCREQDFVKIAVHQYEENVVTSFKSNLLLIIFWLHIFNYNSELN